MPREQVQCVPLYKAPPRRGNGRGHGTEGMTSMRYQRTPVEDRLFPRLVEADDLSPNSWAGCWLWPGAKVRGYGQIRISLAEPNTYASVLTHRVVWQYVVGVIPEGLQLDHLCRRPACCNPAHLEPVTQRENTRRGIGNQNTGRTHCRQGHLLAGPNLRVESYGSRRCRACSLEVMRRYRARRAANGGRPLREEQEAA